MIDLVKPPLDEAYLEHYGVKGMVWGTRKMAKLGGYKTTGDISTAERKRFKREVETAKRGKGLAKDPTISPFTKKPVSKEFARAVLRKTYNDKQRNRHIKTGALVAGAVLAGKAIGSTVRGAT